MHQVTGNLYVGLGYLGSDVETGLRVDAALPPGLPDPRLRTDLRALELPLEYDSRDNNLFPTTGWYVAASAVFHRPSLGSDVDANIPSLEANHYRPVGKRDVLALRAYDRTVVGDDLPFFMLSSFGGKKDLRGYESGRYRFSVSVDLAVGDSDQQFYFGVGEAF